MKLQKGLKSYSLHQERSFPRYLHDSLLYSNVIFPNHSLSPPLPLPQPNPGPSCLFVSTALSTINMSVTCPTPVERFSTNKGTFGLFYSMQLPQLLELCVKHSRCSIGIGWVNENRVPEIDLNTEAVKRKLFKCKWTHIWKMILFHLT